jgi:hypothetical protein
MAASSADLEATKPLLEAWGIASSASLDRVAQIQCALHGFPRMIKPQER